MIEEQQTAPGFLVVDENNEAVSLQDFSGSKNVVLYFYPKDDTSGCTIEANQFTQHIDEFASNGTVVLGVSKDDCQSHRSFIDKYSLKVRLLADIDGKLCEDYGVWQEKEKNGVKKMGIVRSTFIIDKQGVIIYAEYGVPSDGHALQVLEKVKQLS